MSYLTYRLIHLIGIFMVILALGGMIALSGSGSFERSRWKKIAAATHGIGLIVVLIAGFGLLVRLGFDWPWPQWAFWKLGIWLLLALMVVFAKRLPASAALLWWGTLLLTILAAYLALYKPF